MGKQALKPGWLEDSKKISDDPGLSKRELFGLILLASLRNYDSNTTAWNVCFNPEQLEPNDGFVSDGESNVEVEHKIIPQMTNEGVLKAILDTYEKNAKKGEAYGADRTLILHANKESSGLAKLSSLRDKIDGKCHFEQVLLIGCLSTSPDSMVANLQITAHYPEWGVAYVAFDLSSGKADVRKSDIKFP